METALSMLGKAQREGAFRGAGSRYPWEAAGGEVIGLRRRRFDWIRVAIPLAAAAAIGVLFVGPSLFETPAVDEIARSIPTSVLPDQPEAFAEAQPVVATSAQTIDCDYNGDGQIDGRDIQAFVDRVQSTGGDLKLESDYLQRCLLGE
jgi:hypothetical protein